MGHWGDFECDTRRPLRYIEVGKGYECDEQAACDLAVSKGHLNILVWMMANGFSWKSTGCLWRARENGCKWDAESCVNAATGGRLEVLKWLLENGCEWDEATCALFLRATRSPPHLEVDNN